MAEPSGFPLALCRLEAAFYHSVTALSATRTDFDIVANNHGGLITRGPIPAGVIDKARKMSGFARAGLTQKPFADQEDIEELYAGGNAVEKPSYVANI
jgi:hypothetical protein